ncbi:hypothetical protein [Nostoc sp. MG11]|uniref:hypothetical protein n=1 Tax=Nostoc sp. MG11 TaxID=2721166 RepID=UPI001D006C17|nr:hypothetical protein [Nostoc sp. MG11]
MLSYLSNLRIHDSDRCLAKAIRLLCPDASSNAVMLIDTYRISLMGGITSHPLSN